MTTHQSPVTTHVLDTASGIPAVGIDVALIKLDGHTETILAKGTTNSDGRVTDLLKQGQLTAGQYKMRFELSCYNAEKQQPDFYPFAEVAFNISNTERHYHIPLLLSPFGYSTYLGS